MDVSPIINWWCVLEIYFVTISYLFLRFVSSIDTINPHQSIRDSEVLVSNGQIFKMGFFSPANSSHRYLGIMYNVPVMTVIWVANRDNPLFDRNGTVEIYRDGNLVILDGEMEIVWSSIISSSVSNSSAHLLDTGNLVLRDNSNGRIIWESFGHASDSYLREMEISTDLSTNSSNTLTSWRSPSDPAPGSFTASIKPLEIPQLFVWNGSYPYWRSGPWNGQIFTGVQGMSHFYQNGFSLRNDKPENAYLTFTYLNTSNFLYFVMNMSGVLQEKVWSENKGDWVVDWSSIESECDVYNKCGPFGICNAKGMPKCSCMLGFEPINNDEWSQENWTNGCKRRTPLHSEMNYSAGKMGKQDVFLKLKNVKLPDCFKWFPNLETECETQCLNNYSCVAYAFYFGIGCMLWTESLIDVQKFSNDGADLYIRLAYSELGTRKERIALIVTTALLGFASVIVSTFFLWKLIVKYRGNQKKSQLFSFGTGEEELVSKESLLRETVRGVTVEVVPFFKFEVLSSATRNFDPHYMLGKGGFGPVYKGKLLDGQEIAVKRLARSSNQGLEEFMNEVEVISKLQHRNLVKLLGCCVESEEKMLVYEYMPNGSLDAYLFDSQKLGFLDWKRRGIIIEGICRGLLYLHRDSRLKIIHRDLKASNILLDEELNPKISDFGLARIFGGKEDHANTTRIVGTHGYMAPEYVLEGRFSEKSDVYSFGVLLLEIVSGRRNTGFYKDEDALSLVSYAWKLWNECNIIKLMDPIIYDAQMKGEVLRYVHVGLLCVQESVKARPNISTVLLMLNREMIDLPHPKQPAFTWENRSSERTSDGKKPSKYSINDVTVTIVEGR